jgi:hypothetical protein
MRCLAGRSAFLQLTAIRDLYVPEDRPSYHLVLWAAGGTHVYKYQVPERAGPGPNEVSSKLWMCAPALLLTCYLPS